ncbi:MAG: two-component regulator propeller domain-containing protein [Bacteroidales bacterium]
MLSLLLFGISISGLSQTYQFRNYNVDDGLPGRFVYTIDQDNNGFLWLGTGKGIARFDGFSFYPVASSDSLSTAFPVSSYRDSNGTIYYGFNDGKLYITAGSRLEEVKGVDAFRINCILECDEVGILVVSQSKGLYSLVPGDDSRPAKIASPSDDQLFCAATSSSGDIVFGTSQGAILTRFENGRLVKVYEAEELLFSQVQAIVFQEQFDRFILGTEDDGIYVAKIVSDSLVISRLAEDELINSSRVQSLLTDNRSDLWVTTFGNGVLKIQFSDEAGNLKKIERFNTTTGLASNDVKTIMQDSEGNMWMGLFGGGLSILGSDAFSFYKPGNGKNDNNIIYVDEMDGLLLAGTQSGYYLFDTESMSVKGYTDLSKSLGNAKINLFRKFRDGSLLIGTDGNGVFLREKNGRVSRFYNSSNNLQNYVNDIRHDGDLVWIATMGGVVVSNTRTLDYSIYTTYERLPHNNISQLIPDGKGKYYVATEGNRLYTIDPVAGVQAGKAVIYGGVRNRFVSMSVDSEGKIWGATQGAGIFCFAADSVFGMDVDRGLLSNFCYSILCDSKDNVWIGHEQGFSVYDREMNQIRSFVDIFSEGADCNRNAAYETSDGLVVLGTTEGFMIYDRNRDQNRYVPPMTNILSVTINNVEMPYRETYNLPYNSRYDIKVNYVGLYYSDPDKVWYRTRLDNYDDEWADPTPSRVTGYKLSDGNYRFNVVSYNYDGITNNEVAGFNLVIRKPVWRMWWFLLALFVVASGIVVMVIRIRDRAQRRAKANLEDELAERTRLVILQKEEIELQNREITDSINYAQRIQASPLPPVSKLNEAFRGSFVFYRPRDIVSGDFYWFERIDHERFIIVCADSTGHGVPGAFMSMIGSALIQEIVTRKEITRPSEVLLTLDKEISKTLNQGHDGKSTSDGMDMVVCEFNSRTKLLRFASAMRPVIIVMDGEQYYIRGNKNSVGGESISDKYFDDQEYYLKDNDSFYMFSDGLPDQFGGDSGKKMKIAKLKSLIEEIKDQQMDEQFRMVSDFFDLWKGDLDQVDDVLFMGIRV